MRRILATALLLIATPVLADATAQHHIQRLSSGSDRLVREAAREIYYDAYNNPAVLDVAAEVLLRGRNTRNADAMAWICRALGESGNGRYTWVVAQASNAFHYKLESHCGAAAEALSGKPGTPYQAGSADFSVPAPEPEPERLPQTADTPPTGGGAFNQLVLGMRASQVERLIGQPTTLSLRISTRPFERSDLRQYARYRGKGVIVYSKDIYRPYFRVVRIIENTQESGYGNDDAP